MVVHNKDMIEEVSKYDIETMDDANFDRLSIIKQIVKENDKDKIVVSYCNFLVVFFWIYMIFFYNIIISTRKIFIFININYIRALKFVLRY